MEGQRNGQRGCGQQAGWAGGLLSPVTWHQRDPGSEPGVQHLQEHRLWGEVVAPPQLPQAQEGVVVEQRPWQAPCAELAPRCSGSAVGPCRCHCPRRPPTTFAGPTACGPTMTAN